MFKERIDDPGDPTRNAAASRVLELPARPERPEDKLRAFESARKGEALALAPEAEKGPAPEHRREAPAEAGEDRSQKAASRRRPLVRVFGVAALAVAAGAGALWWDNASHFEATDDAFIASRPIGLAPQVPGFVAQVLVTDNQHVARGQTIARIDDRDYLVALAQAQAKVAVAQAGVTNIDAQIAVQRAQVDAAQAQLDQAQAALAFARQQATRYGELARTGYGSVQNAQQYSSQLAQQQAAVKSASASLEVARRQVDSLQAQAKSAEADLAQAKAQQDQAKLNLSYTDVVAAESGRVVDLTAAPGEYAQTGTNLAMFVPDRVWVTANFKETELDRMRPGDPVTLRIDAYPERRIRGHVASVQPGSGTAFSLLPPENATGNYVKIVQRVPVKIELDNPPRDVALGPGMSVVPTVRVDPHPSLNERLVGFFDSKARRS
ncbi:HlyD family secretion protein [Rhodoblastus sp.]|uniref:HlyD family secretion protein n=1 Tax=Rhodoblastus sp. TaxID=1962975 RepID=UPI003F9EAACC